MATPMANSIIVHCSPEDGDCLFVSIIHQLHLVNPQRPLISVEQMRSDVVRYIRDPNNIQFFTPTLLDSCLQVYHSEIIKTMTENQLILKYLSDLEQRGFWGGSECICAICNMQQIKINIHRFESGNYYSFTPYSGQFLFEINILYSGTHYDSVTFSQMAPLANPI